MSDLKTMLASVVDQRLEGAKCAGMAPLFDPRNAGESDGQFRSRLFHARTVCLACPVRPACAEVGNEIPKTTPAGIWGGLDLGDRK